MPTIRQSLLSALIICWLLSACAAPAAPQPTALPPTVLSPSSTPQPTATPVPTGTPTPLPTPTSTYTPIPTPTYPALPTLTYGTPVTSNKVCFTMEEDYSLNPNPTHAKEIAARYKEILFRYVRDLGLEIVDDPNACQLTLDTELNAEVQMGTYQSGTTQKGCYNISNISGYIRLLRGEKVYYFGKMDLKDEPKTIRTCYDEQTIEPMYGNLEHVILTALTGMWGAAPVFRVLENPYDQFDLSAARAAVGDMNAFDGDIPLLLEKVGSSEENLRYAAVRGLGLTGEAATIPPLLEALSDPSPRVRALAAEWLGTKSYRGALKIKVKSGEYTPEEVQTVLNALVGALSDPDANVQLAAVLALKTTITGFTRAELPLDPAWKEPITVLASHAHPEIQQAAREILEAYSATGN